MFYSDAQVPAWFRARVSPAVPQELYTIHRRLPRKWLRVLPIGLTSYNFEDNVFIETNAAIFK